MARRLALDQFVCFDQEIFIELNIVCHNSTALAAEQTRVTAFQFYFELLYVSNCTMGVYISKSIVTKLSIVVLCVLHSFSRLYCFHLYDTINVRLFSAFHVIENVLF